jgi:hypothetical protein
MAIGGGQKPRPGQNLGKKFLEQRVTAGMEGEGTQETDSELDDLSFTLRPGRRHDNEIVSIAPPQP